ncbi:MAG: alpha amylase C-terminal domain-containing protein [Fibrobacteres bacterium]|nr:alpha amylase C-terminal domain-containing protein [Fibrobacterota bacterium]
MKKDSFEVPSLVQMDPYLAPYTDIIRNRINAVNNRISEFTGGKKDFKKSAHGHLYFGVHKTKTHWVFREWAPNLIELFLIGEFNGWQRETKYAFKRMADNRDNWELKVPLKNIQHGQLYRLYISWAAGEGNRIPAWATRTVQDPDTKEFNAQIWFPDEPYEFKHSNPQVRTAPLVYEAHVGMAGEEPRVSTYEEFRINMLPRIVEAGYNTIQLMAVQEHPYYGSFGYHVSSYFAPSSRFGTPDELKRLVDEAHGLGLRIIMDIVHSHSVKNEIEGLSRYDGTYYQFFHEGHKGDHIYWDSRCFNYSKPEVQNFLLSNLRYWLEEFKFDGFRFDGVTSMLYLDHGMNRAFTNYSQYYDGNQDDDAMMYIGMANKLVHEINPFAITIAEEMSGMPGLALPVEQGGYGFDYRFAMGTPDYWIKIVKTLKDEEWNMDEMFHELNNRRMEEKTISYAESHDQAIVGDKTIIFRLADKAMYTDMHVAHGNLVIDRAIALHKMVRLVTISTAGNGYLNFMGNEFGHPEWVDFPREGNGWSYHYARRQWSLAFNKELRYHYMYNFDKAMTKLISSNKVLEDNIVYCVTVNNGDKIIAFKRAGLLFVFNFNATQSFPDYGLNVESGTYRIALSSDSSEFGGHNRVDSGIDYFSSSNLLKMYIPSRTALVFRKI